MLCFLGCEAEKAATAAAFRMNPNTCLPRMFLFQGESAYTDRYASQETFEPRSPEEIATLCRAWEHYVHPRAREFWQTSEARIEILSEASEGLNIKYSLSVEWVRA